MDARSVTSAPGQRPERYHFGGVVVDVAAHSLHVDGEPRAIEPKTYAVLVELLRHHGELVTRDQLLDAVWGHRHVTSGVLTRAIAQLRHALGDDSHAQRCIQTQHALGYRFIATLDDPSPAYARLDATPGALEALRGADGPTKAPLPAPEPARRATRGHLLATRPGRRRSDRWRPWRWALVSAGLILLASMLLASRLMPSA